MEEIFSNIITAGTNITVFVLNSRIKDIEYLFQLFITNILREFLLRGTNLC